MIAVLGSGLSGLLSAYALDKADIDFEIISKEIRPSKPKGFVLLHDNCDLVLNDEIIKVVQDGKNSVYKSKLGYDSKVNSSWRDGVEEYYLHGYNIFEAIETLQNKYNNRIKKETITPEDVKHLNSEYEKVISTIPPNNLDDSIDLEFSSIYVGGRHENSTMTHPIVIYHGQSAPDPVLRTSLNLWGKNWMEYAEEPEGMDTKKVRKPVTCNGKLRELPFILTGRFGRWNKHVLAHNVYYKVRGLIRDGEIPK